MNPDLRRSLLWPSVFAILFFAIPPLLFYSYPSSFWAATDYEPLGLADALNMAYRIADGQRYPAKGMTGHPGVTFYFYYLQSRVEMISSMTAGLDNREVGAYVIDKNILPTAESIKASPNIAVFGPKPVTLKDGDRLVELRTVFLLIRG